MPCGSLRMKHRFQALPKHTAILIRCADWHSLAIVAAQILSQRKPYTLILAVLQRKQVHCSSQFDVLQQSRHEGHLHSLRNRMGATWQSLLNRLRRTEQRSGPGRQTHLEGTGVADDDHQLL